MEKKIYYFSGTGNSYYYAHSLAKHFNTNEISINEESDFDLKSKSVILCFPNYFGKMPISVYEFLNKISLDNFTKFYVFVSASSNNGNILAEVDTLLKEKSSHLAYGAYIKSPDNNVTKLWYRSKADIICKSILNRGKDLVLSYASLIENEQDMPYKKGNNKPLKYGKLTYKEFNEKLNAFGDKFMVTSECIRCRMCELNCDKKNIDFLEGVLVWKDKCEGCLKCINSCPYDAIEFEGITRGKRRYKNPIVSIDEYGFFLEDEEENNE